MKHPKQSQIRHRARGGFTLVEMLLVLVILATLAAIVYPKFSGRTEQAKSTSAKAQIASFQTALDAYEIDNGNYPRSLNALWEDPGNASNWRGPYLPKAVTADPWGTPYVYECPGKHNPNGYDLYSAGADLRAGTEDDITNWSDSKR